MTILTGTFETPNASKYLQQLCKHFGHKIETEFTKTEGTCHFDMGPAYMKADDRELRVSFELDGPQSEDAARDVIDRHLEKFAFREEFNGMQWR
ncbi:hypothetical protein BOO69_02280 [Sulfitobacter alexandrii]|uniref:DUF2218 domain-containing protein n=1 Tax=Sulfitobacter alexandrii TaxID=1917485 RepID=A0A1J0WDH4_9RHOB|nr:DUF2218 domain-containing protein [Sulfitobacter alexandrii]APE42369.1 hypothetical protein BOO69_02280 [Sulfitobacter alexandrii]